MEATIIDKQQMTLVGLSFFGDPFRASAGWTEENEIGRLWQRFMTFLTDHGDRIRHLVDAAVGYEVHVTGAETASTGEFEVFVGVEVERLEAVPVELLVKVLPPTRYAVFTLRGVQITGDWSKAIAEWMRDTNHEQAHPFGFQLYDARFQGLDNLEVSAIDVYVPIARGGGTREANDAQAYEQD